MRMRKIDEMVKDNENGLKICFDRPSSSSSLLESRLCAGIWQNGDGRTSKLNYDIEMMLNFFHHSFFPVFVLLAADAAHNNVLHYSMITFTSNCRKAKETS